MLSVFTRVHTPTCALLYSNITVYVCHRRPVAPSRHYNRMSRVALRPRTAPIDRAESLLTLTSSIPTITSPAATRNTVKGPGARLHGHQSYFGAHRQRMLALIPYHIPYIYAPYTPLNWIYMCFDG